MGAWNVSEEAGRLGKQWALDRVMGLLNGRVFVCLLFYVYFFFFFFSFVNELDEVSRITPIIIIILFIKSFPLSKPLFSASCLLLLLVSSFCFLYRPSDSCIVLLLSSS